MPNTPVQVNVRIETGDTNTSLDLTVKTWGHYVQPDTGPARCADGTNGNENPLPGPTCTSALDDASRPPSGGQRPFTWDGKYYLNLDDLQITEINKVKAVDNSTFWSLWVNFKYANVGGGQLQINKGDSVLWALIPVAYGPVPASIPLKLKGPRIVPVNQNFSVTVINGSDGSPVRHAIIKYGSQKSETDKYGMANVTLSTVGRYTLKATRDDDIVSNALKIEVK